jgi:hypothetical protein
VLVVDLREEANPIFSRNDLFHCSDGERKNSVVQSLQLGFRARARRRVRVPITNFVIWAQTAEWDGLARRFCCASDGRDAHATSNYIRPKDQIDDIAHILLIRQTLQAFFRKRDDCAQVLGKLPKQFKPVIRF